MNPTRANKSHHRPLAICGLAIVLNLGWTVGLAHGKQTAASECVNATAVNNTCAQEATHMPLKRKHRRHHAAQPADPTSEDVFIAKSVAVTARKPPKH